MKRYPEASLNEYLFAPSAADDISQVTLEINTRPQKETAGEGSSSSQEAKNSKDIGKGQNHQRGAAPDVDFEEHPELLQ